MHMLDYDTLPMVKNTAHIYKVYKQKIPQGILKINIWKCYVLV